MPETEQQDKTLSELIVKEAINKGMDTPMRDSILEAVDEADGSRSGGRLPLAGALFALGATVGFLIGRQSPDLDDSPIEDLEEPEILEDVMESTEETEAVSEVTEESESETDDSGSRRLPGLLLMLGAVAGAVFLRRRFSSDEEEEWEPIEEFEPATGGETEEESETADMDGSEAEETDEEIEE